MTTRARNYNPIKNTQTHIYIVQSESSGRFDDIKKQFNNTRSTQRMHSDFICIRCVAAFYYFITLDEEVKLKIKKKKQIKPLFQVVILEKNFAVCERISKYNKINSNTILRRLCGMAWPFATHTLHM